MARIEAVSCDSSHEAAWLERNLLETSLPPWNRTPGGQEGAVFIRLDTGPVTPRLAVTFRAEPADRMRYFGPYLGGPRVRHAVCALNRLLPLSYTAARLGGAEHDLARVQGVAGGDRMALIGSLTAVLDRQPAAVRWTTSQLSGCGPRSQRPGVRVRRPGPGRDRGAELDQLTAAGHKHGRCEPHDLRLVRRHAGPIPGPRWPAPQLIAAATQPGHRRPAAGLYPGGLKTSPSATPNRPRAWLSLQGTTRTTRHTPRPGSGHAEHPFRCDIHRQATDHDHSADRRFALTFRSRSVTAAAIIGFGCRNRTVASADYLAAPAIYAATI
jgi:hypothetical protein